MKFYMSIILLLFVYLTLEAKNKYSAQDTLFEIFPLRQNLHYTYDYISQSETREVVVLTELVTDSGTVDYIIHDSTYLNDTTVLWNIEQRRSIFHNYSVSLNYGMDTTYWIRDTSFFYIKETTTGFHQLTSKSFLWEFPVIISSDTQQIFRYSSNPYKVMIKNWSSNTGLCSSGIDTILFENNKGFAQRISSSAEGGCVNTHKYFFTNFKLHNDPVVSIFDSKSIHVTFSLEQNYPNPFNPATNIEYFLEKGSKVEINIYDILGNRIVTLFDGYKTAGKHKEKFIANNPANGTSLPSGIYFYSINVNGMQKTKSMVLLK